nr:immunoglobulin heavy chain junction region [Mus musculus]
CARRDYYDSWFVYW